MRDLNSVNLVGCLTSDADLRQFDNGGCIVSFSIAVNSSIKQDNEWTDYPNYFNVKYSGKNLSSLASFLTKGKMVAVSGSLKQDRWEKDGKKNSAVIVDASQVQLVGGFGDKKDKGNESDETQSDPFPEDFTF